MTEAKMTYAWKLPEKAVFALVISSLSIYVRKVNMSSSHGQE